MIYLDTSVALAQLLQEQRRPPAELWSETLVSSRLFEYELWNRLNSYQLQSTHGDVARQLLARIALVELANPVLVRALQPFPVGVRTLDALHLATLDFLRQRGLTVRLASYDDRLNQAAQTLGYPLAVV